MVTARAHHLADAKCVAEALGEDDGAIEPSDQGWTVSVVQSSSETGNPAGALYWGCELSRFAASLKGTVTAVRTVFWLYVCLIAVGLAFYIGVGLHG